MHINDSEVTPPLTEWQAFDRDGVAVEVDMPEGITLQVGDTIRWSLAQFEGFCEVVEVVQPESTRRVLVRKT